MKLDKKKTKTENISACHVEVRLDKKAQVQANLLHLNDVLIFVSLALERINKVAS